MLAPTAGSVSTISSHTLRKEELYSYAKIQVAFQRYGVVAQLNISVSHERFRRNRTTLRVAVSINRFIILVWPWQPIFSLGTVSKISKINAYFGINILVFEQGAVSQVKAYFDLSILVLI